MIDASSGSNDWQNFFFNSEGRLNRRSFNILAGASFIILSCSALALPVSGQVISFLFILAITACPVIKRLHDREYSGIWYAYFFLVLMLSIILMMTPIAMIFQYAKVALYTNAIQSSSAAVWNPAHALAFLIMLGILTYLAMIGWFMAELCYFRGTEGPNEYGPDPVENSSSSSYESFL